MSAFRPRHLLAALPTLGIVAGVPLANRVHRLVWGLPFLLVWILGCVLATSALLALLRRLDRGAGAPPPDSGAPR